MMHLDLRFFDLDEIEHEQLLYFSSALLMSSVLTSSPNAWTNLIVLRLYMCMRLGAATVVVGSSYRFILWLSFLTVVGLSRRYWEFEGWGVGE